MKALETHMFLEQLIILVSACWTQLSTSLCAILEKLANQIILQRAASQARYVANITQPLTHLFPDESLKYWSCRIPAVKRGLTRNLIIRKQLKYHQSLQICYN